MSGSLPSRTAFPEAVAAATSAAGSGTQEFGDFFLSRFLGLDIAFDDEDRTCTVRLPYARHLTNPQGAVHGGILTTAIDISMGHLCQRHLSASVTVEMQLRFFRPVTTDCLATGRFIRAGRRLVHVESRMTDTAGDLVAFGVGTWHRLDALAPRSS
ncbi:PaaI family thioesterase [Ornithinimicrobium cavernae]|uniref:PaaI family thioesterase n=1 Tax=Ornithinimicrobium cavernae TaxID=2666047 RepID=UPI0012B179D2|nr:PaaI family thioesterase [Ornithinimicrobium cavernae]